MTRLTCAGDQSGLAHVRARLLALELATSQHEGDVPRGVIQFRCLDDPAGECPPNMDDSMILIWILDDPAGECPPLLIRLNQRESILGSCQLTSVERRHQPIDCHPLH